MTPRFCTQQSLGGRSATNDQGNQRNLLTKEDPSEDGELSAAFFGGIWTWLGNHLNAWTYGMSMERRAKLERKWFAEKETGDLVHTMSFQKRLPDSGGDSSNKARYERFAVAVPCEGWDPVRLFELTYKWSEATVQILSNIPSNVLRESTISVELRHTGHLQLWMERVAHADSEGRVTHHTTHARENILDHVWMYHSGARGGERTDNSLIGLLVGRYDSYPHHGWTPFDFKGFTTYFACGPRREVHNLPTVLSGQQPGAAQSGTSFRQCVADGVETNRMLKNETPGEPFYPDEVVVRLTFGAVQQCGGWFKGPNFPYHDLDDWRWAYNVWQHFQNQVSQCSGPTPPRYNSNTYGIIHGAGMPEILDMVVIDPEDLVQGIESLQ